MDKLINVIHTAVMYPQIHYDVAVLGSFKLISLILYLCITLCWVMLSSSTLQLIYHCIYQITYSQEDQQGQISRHSRERPE